MPRIYTAITPAYNSEDTILQALTSLIQLQPPPAEIIVVDDASTDRTPQLVKQFKGAQLLQLRQNMGPGTARNRGAETAKTPWLLFIDADCQLPPSALKNSFPTENEAPNIVGFMGVFSPTGPAHSPVATYKNMQRHYEIREMQNPPNIFTSSCFTIKRSAYLENGGFNEAFGKVPTEDNEFYFRLSKNKLAIKYNTAFNFTHHKNMTTANLFRDGHTRAKAITLNMFGYLGETRGGWNKHDTGRWALELLAGNTFLASTILAPISLCLPTTPTPALALLAAITSALFMASLNRALFLAAYKSGGVKLLAMHLFLRSIEMTAAATGIAATVLNLIFKRAKAIPRRNEKKHAP